MVFKRGYDKAIDYYEKALEINLIVFGSQHPKVATGYNNLGGAWDSKGEYDKAIDYYEKALQIYLNAFGSQHPNVASEYSNLGGAWDSKGNTTKPLTTMKRRYKYTWTFLAASIQTLRWNTATSAGHGKRETI
jgi:tetratricopeptide (TPR) repeat protein